MNGDEYDTSKKREITKSSTDQIRSTKKYLQNARKLVDDHLSRLEDSISAKWLQQQLEWSSPTNDSRASLITKNSLLQSQLKITHDETNHLIAMLQRQQDARLRSLTMRRIRSGIRISFSSWREVRSNRVMYAVSEYRLLLRTLNTALRNHFWHWAAAVARHRRVQALGTRCLSAVLTALRARAFAGWRAHHTTAAATALVRSAASARVLSAVMDGWRALHRNRQRTADALRVQHCRSLPPAAAIIAPRFRAWAELQALRAALTAACRRAARLRAAALLRASLRGLRLVARRRREELRLRRRAASAQAARLLAAAMAALRGLPHRRRDLLAQRLDAVAPARRAAAFHGWYREAGRGRALYRTGLRVVLGVMRRCLGRAIAGWARQAHLRSRLTRAAGRWAASAARRGAAATLRALRDAAAAQRRLARSAADWQRGRAGRGLRAGLAGWRAAVSVSRSRSRLVASIQARLTAGPARRAMTAWRGCCARTALLRYLGLRVLLRRLRACMAAAFRSWDAVGGRVLQTQAAAQQAAAALAVAAVRRGSRCMALRLWAAAAARGYERAGMARLAEARSERRLSAAMLARWRGQMREVAIWRRQGRQLVLRWITNLARRIVWAWADCVMTAAASTAAAAAWARERAAQHIGLAWCVSSWAGRGAARQGRAAAVQAKDAMLQRRGRLVSYHRWVRWALGRARQRRMDMTGDAAVLLHRVQMRRTWAGAVSAFSSWKYLSRLKPIAPIAEPAADGGSKEGGGVAVDGSSWEDEDRLLSEAQSAVVMSSVPRLHFDAPARVPAQDSARPAATPR